MLRVGFELNALIWCLKILNAYANEIGAYTNYKEKEYS